VNAEHEEKQKEGGTEEKGEGKIMVEPGRKKTLHRPKKKRIGRKRTIMKKKRTILPLLGKHVPSRNNIR
jgi:hypothetical protein